jgi:hypothetical protein
MPDWQVVDSADIALRFQGMRLFSEKNAFLNHRLGWGRLEKRQWIHPFSKKSAGGYLPTD